MVRSLWQRRTAKDTLTALPAPLVEAARAGVEQAGMAISQFSAPEGYLETRWFNPRTRSSHRENTDPSNLVRLRVWTDLVTPRETQVVVETVRRMTIDPSVPDREVEVVAEPGTPGDSLTQIVRALVRQRFGAQTSDSNKAATP
jgi:hypothetical protein